MALSLRRRKVGSGLFGERPRGAVPAKRRAFTDTEVVGSSPSCRSPSVSADYFHSLGWIILHGGRTHEVFAPSVHNAPHRANATGAGAQI